MNCTTTIISNFECWLDLENWIADNFAACVSCDHLVYFVWKFDHVVEMFGEEVKKVQPDEFFGYFDQFLSGLAEARVDNRVMMKQKEDEEKKAQRDAEVRDLTDAFLLTQGFINRFWIPSSAVEYISNLKHQNCATHYKKYKYIIVSFCRRKQKGIKTNSAQTRQPGKEMVSVWKKNFIVSFKLND